MRCIIILLLLTPFFLDGQQNVAINTDGSSPDPSALLDIQSTSKGVLIPRLDSMQRVMIASPAQGLLVFDITKNSFQFYNGTSWIDLSSPFLLSDADQDTKITVEQNPDEDKIRFMTDSQEHFVMDGPRLEVLGSGSSVFIGEGTGENDDLTNNRNVFVGKEAGNQNTIGAQNTAVGYKSFYSNTIGNNNTASGYLALYHNTTGSSNTASGSAALYHNTTGSHNTASGSSALYHNTNGSSNTASGRRALYNNTTGSHNTASGYFALYHNTTGIYNTASGSSALYSNTTGSHNTASGYFALYHNTTGIHNTASGRTTLYHNTTGNYNTASGSTALFNNTTGSHNTASGYAALNKNTTGSYNTASGRAALYNNTTGNYNTASGYFALNNNTMGNNNTAIGANALESNTEGEYNLGIGNSSLLNQTTGSRNVAVGAVALRDATGSWNSALGVNAGQKNTGDSNVFVGFEAGRDNFGNSNVFIGNQAGKFATGSNKLYIENSSGSTPLIFGDFVNDEVGMGTTSPSDRLHINSGPTQNALRVQVDGSTRLRVYSNGGLSVGYNTTPSYALQLQNSSTQIEGKAVANSWNIWSDGRIKTNQKIISYGLADVLNLSPKSYTLHNSDYAEDGSFTIIGQGNKEDIGFIAQEAYEVIPQIVNRPSNENEELWSMDYTRLIPVLVKAIQEQQEIINNLESRIEILEN